MWSPMTLNEFARSEQATGAEIVESKGFYWRKIRPFFYRPLLPDQLYTADDIQRPPGKFNAFQYAVADQSKADSSINLMVYDDMADYSIENLRKHHRRHVRAALKSDMEIRPMASLEELIRDGYEVYCSFYERTQYEFGKDRLNHDVFVQWAEAQMGCSGLLVLGVYLKERMLGIYISYRIGDTVYLKTAINSKEAIRLRAPELAMHLYREEARNLGVIKWIVDGPYVPADGINAFKFRRGAKAIALPAHLEIPPLLLKAIQWCKPGIYHALTGYSEDEMSEKSFSDCKGA